ncbi:MAG TPA: TonB-dependent receptor [Planctomycetota bacterium]|nr:TonB-dependent receptor [Planctomycetota bacterium]
MLSFSTTASGQETAGSIRGVVHDKDFDLPLAAAQVLTVETGQRVTTTDQGNYIFSLIPPGTYTLVFIKDGYVRQVKAGVVVLPGQLTDVDVSLAGEFTEMDEFLVQDILQLGAGTEAALLRMRFESPALMDSIGSDLMSRAGASDAASGLRLVAGASVQDGKFAVIRGLPDRYVNSQMNGVRLPTADEDKRAVELDQFPAAVIESIQVSKTFTPDQQGDASGGAVNLRLKGIPDETVLQFKHQITFNSNVTGRDDFLSYDGGGVGDFGYDDGGRDMQLDRLGRSWDGAAGVSREHAPIDFKWSGAAGANHKFDNGVKIGGFASLFYERGSAFFDDRRDDSMWVTQPGAGMVPTTYQGTPQDGDFKTGLFDAEQGQRWVRWGGLATFGVETENHLLGLTYLFTHSATDVATVAEDTRGKEYFFPGYDPNDPTGNGNTPGTLNAAPYLRLETLEYTERTTGTLQLNGRHKLPFEEFELGSFVKFKRPEVDWTLARSDSALDQPDKRQFGSLFLPASFHPGGPFNPPFTTPPTWFPYKPGANFNLGNFQRIWKTIDEDSEQGFANLKLPFEQWSGNEGYLKFGVFHDQLERSFDQDTFSNFGDSAAKFFGGWDEYWSSHFPNELHPITASQFDVDYKGEQKIEAGYGMVDLPLTGSLDLVGGARYETTHIAITNDPESGATWFPPGASAPVALNPGDADVSFNQHDVLPSIGLEYRPIEKVTLRGAWSQTVARQTFKELTPIIQQEFLGGPVFIGNPDLEMSGVENYDLRLDYTPYEGSLVSLSWFDKRIDEPIEYVQRLAGFTFTTPVNYPKGKLSGYEVEVRQSLGNFWKGLEGLSVGANGTFIDSQVSLPADEIAGFNLPGIQAPTSSRDMTNAPEHLYNFYLTYDVPRSGTQLAVFYTVQGDTLIAGAGQSNGNYIPDVYAREYGTLNFSLSQKLGKHFKLQLQAKNLTDPEIEEVYRSKYIGEEVKKTSYTRGVEYSLSLAVSF